MQESERKQILCLAVASKQIKVKIKNGTKRKQEKQAKLKKMDLEIPIQHFQTLPRANVSLCGNKLVGDEAFKFVDRRRLYYAMKAKLCLLRVHWVC
jgi:hypothetical protein